MERIILVRHGQTNKDAKGEIHAFGDDELLNEVGVKQIKKTAKRLKEFHPIKIYCSKNRRALQSGKIIAETLGIREETIDGMEERNWGDFSGKKWGEVEQVLNKMTLEERYLYIPPNGESWEQFETRLISAIKDLLSKNEGRTFVVVAHGGAIRALMPYFLSASGDESFKHQPGLASITIFDYQNDKFTPVTMDDTSHLE